MVKGKRSYTRKKTKGVSGWKSSRKPKKASALVRQTESNRKQIAELKGTKEVKRADDKNCDLSRNWCGQILQSTQVDNYGMNQSSADYAAIALLPPPNNQYLAPRKYNPVWQMPIYVQQGPGEKQRIGNKVKMHRLHIKGQVQGGFASSNTGMYEGITVPQELSMYVVLDTAPSPENTTLQNTEPSWQAPAMAGQLFTFANNWNPLLPIGTSIAQVRNLLAMKQLILQTANPPGFRTNKAHKDLLNLSYFTTDESGIGEDNRYKILKRFKYNFNQHPANSEIGAQHQPPIVEVQSRKFVREFSETLTLPYVFTFPNDKSVVPDNQRLYLIFCSSTPTVRNYGATAPTDYVDPPQVTTHCRFMFSDS